MSERIEKARAKVDLSYVALTAKSSTMSDEKAAQRAHAALDDLIAAVREDERERCAEAAEDCGHKGSDDDNFFAWKVAQAIRRRGAP